MTPTYRTTSVDGLKMFYREAGDPKAPTVLLLARLSHLLAHVPGSDSRACRSLPRSGAGFARFRLH
jgi:hypothetical protein